MIHNYSDHAANERTFLAWLRTGISIIAFGFVIEKFSIFLATLATVSVPAPEADWIVRRRLGQGAFTEYEGVALMGLGIVVIGIAAARYLRNRKMIDAQERTPTMGAAPELTLAATLAALTLLYCMHIFL
jgi:putative membrane protein